MDSLVGLFKVARLYNQFFGKLDDILCVECKKKYKQWVEYCEKCGSDHVVFIDPRKNDGQHFLNLPEHLKEICLNNAISGSTAERVRDKLLSSDVDKETAERLYRAQKFAILLVEEQKVERRETEHQVKGEIHKRCPFCAELILYEAVVCKHCGRDLGDQKMKSDKIVRKRKTKRKQK